MVSLPSPIQQLNDDLFEQHHLKVFMKRDDLLHEEIMGNKWRKLKYNLKYALDHGYEGLLTFGGAYSNHIAATAAAALEFGFKSIGYIRGEELNINSNHTLRFASSKQMKLQFLDRDRFKTLKQNYQELEALHPDYYILPEGGTNQLAINGCSEIIAELDQSYDYVIAPVGTGGTLAGILKGLNGAGHVIGISSLKGDWITDEFKKLCETHQIDHQNYQIIKEFHFGGYGKVSDQLIDFINRTKQKIGVQLDPIYTGKMYFGMMNLTAQGYFPAESKVLILHTGGLQGIAGYNEKATKKILL